MADHTKADRSPEDPSSRSRLLDEVRRRADVRRRNRRRRFAGVALFAVVAALALAVPLGVFRSGNATTVRVAAPLGGAPTTGVAPTSNAPPTVVNPTTGVAPTTRPGPTTSSSTLVAPTTAPVSATALLPIVVCPTTFGIVPPPAPASMPASMRVNVPAALAAQLAVYSDNQGTMKLVGPRGWVCVASYGADGSGGVAVHPDGQSIPSGWTAGWKLSPGSPDQAIVGIQTSACQGCATAQACALFTAAANDFRSSLGRACPTVRPSSESVQQMNTGLVAFEDPPGIAGDGNPSGGQNPANGVMTYYSGDQQGSWLETCTLSGNNKALCTTALNTFVTWYGRL